MATEKQDLILNAHTLTLSQRCSRRLVIESHYKYRKPTPVSFFSHVMRESIFSLSNGADVESVTELAVSNFLSVARSPGFDVPPGSDVYAVAVDLSACIRTILHYLSCCPLLPVKLLPPISVASDLFWQPLSWLDETGTCHRWRFLDYITEDNMVAEVRSWYVAADTMALAAPMSLHFVGIGQVRRSVGGKPDVVRELARRHVAWCKGYKDHTNFNNIRFSRVNSEGRRIGPDPQWTPVFVADLIASSKQPDLVQNWVSSMLASDVIDRTLIRHVHVESPSKPALFEFSRQLQLEAERISNFPSDYTLLPHSRPACDRPSPCPHVYACYEANFDFTRSGLYDKIKRGK